MLRETANNLAPHKVWVNSFVSARQGFELTKFKPQPMATKALEFFSDSHLLKRAKGFPVCF
jgi:hypothetical protein